MSAPNIETYSSITGFASGGGEGGVKVGVSPSEKLGFYGVAGQVQAANIPAPTLTGTYASDYAAMQTYMNAVSDLLKNLGLTA